MDMICRIISTHLYNKCNILDHAECFTERRDERRSRVQNNQ